MRRVAHPYMRWEDYGAGMYDRTVGGPEDMETAYELLTDPEAFANALQGMLAAWPQAAEHWLSRPGAKSRSWLGAAACSHRHGVPQHCTRAAWWLMTAEQQAAANAIADQARTEWMNTREARGAENA